MFPFSQNFEVIVNQKYGKEFVAANANSAVRMPIFYEEEEGIRRPNVNKSVVCWVKMGMNATWIPPLASMSLIGAFSALQRQNFDYK